VIELPADERGGASSVEAAILTVVVGLLIALAIAGGRLVSAEAAVDHAARAAARVASLQRLPEAAESSAIAAARSSLDEQGLACDSLTVAVDTTQFGRPIGTPAAVRASVTCAVRWSDLGLPVLAGVQEVEGEFTSPIDQVRERL
jgi:Flp pilus assembly protein TadG